MSTQRIDLEHLMYLSDSKRAINESRANPNHVNVSSLHNLCARRHYFANTMKNKLSMAQYTGGNVQLTFCMGRALEDYFKSRFLEHIPITKVLGYWELRGRDPINSKYVKLLPNKKGIKVPHEMRFGTKEDTLDDYAEIEVFSKEYKCVGHIDWVYLDDNGKITPVELKSISRPMFNDNFVTKSRPVALPEHVQQLAPYLYLLGDEQFIKDNNLSVNRDGYIFYICKDYRQRTEDEKKKRLNSNYRSFKVSLANEAARTKNLLSESKLAIDSIKEGNIPPRTICKDYSCSTAKKCPFVARCFNYD